MVRGQGIYFETQGNALRHVVFHYYSFLHWNPSYNATEVQHCWLYKWQKYTVISVKVSRVK